MNKNVRAGKMSNCKASYSQQTKCQTARLHIVNKLNVKLQGLLSGKPNNIRPRNIERKINKLHQNHS